MKSGWKCGKVGPNRPHLGKGTTEHSELQLELRTQRRHVGLHEVECVPQGHTLDVGGATVVVVFLQGSSTEGLDAWKGGFVGVVLA